MVVDVDCVGNTGTLNTAGDDIFHGLDAPLLATDTEATVARVLSAWLLPTDMVPAAAANAKPVAAGNDGGHFANVSCQPLQNIMSVCGAS